MESLELLAELYSQMADWQMKFDEQQMREASDRKSRWLLWSVVVAVAVVAVG